ncbi:hypothetical protein Tco_1485742 [Tanacetum coccineum]
MDFAKPVKAITLPQDVLSTSDRRLIKLENQVQRLMEAHLASMQPTQINKITISCEIYSGPHDTRYCMKDPEQAFVEYASSRTNRTGSRQSFLKSLMTLPFVTLQETEEVESEKEVEEETEGETKEEEEDNMEHFDTFPTMKKLSVEPSKTNYTNRKNANETDKEVESEKEVEEETEGETEEEEEDNLKHFDTFPTMKELRYHEWLLKNPRSPWVKAKIRTGNVNNVKFSCMIGQFNKEQAYLDLESPINIMSRRHYNWIMSNRLEPRRKPLNPKKNCNFIGRVKGLKVFLGNFTYECDFMVLEDTTSVIDHYLGSVVFEKSFVEATGLVYNKEDGTVMFERDKEKIMFKIPYKMDMFKHIDFTDISTNRIPPFIVESDDDNREKTHYSGSLDLGPEYKYDEYVCRGIRSLMAAKARRKNKGEVTKFFIKNEEEIFTDTGDGVRVYPDGVASPAIKTYDYIITLILSLLLSLYLTRRSLEVLRKFHLTTLGG